LNLKRKISTIITCFLLSAVFVGPNLDAQVYISNFSSKIYFGPSNVSSVHILPSRDYIQEIDDSIQILKKNAETRLSGKTYDAFFFELATLNSIKQDWLKYELSTVQERSFNNTKDQVTVKEFFDISDQFKQFSKFPPNKDYDCLSIDCLAYDKIKRNKIILKDDFGKQLDLNTHTFVQLGFDGDTRIERVYSKRELQP